MKRVKRLQLRGYLIASFFAFILALPMPGYAQTKTIQGTVIDSKTKLPVAGVSVGVTGVKGGTITADNGTFTITVQEGQTLEFSGVGHKKLNAVKPTGSTITIELEGEIQDLSDVVVVGYGRQKKANLTGAVETISAKAFESRAVTNVGLALQGQTPGLLVMRGSPRPGNEDLTFRIRGASSVNGSDPLIVVDGVPVLNNYSFQNLNSDDIESISILKDGAAAIYGSRASNGVILVTTKRGKEKCGWTIMPIFVSVPMASLLILPI
ncbi:TonB-dependent receptor plug domain-containing protein [Paraflavitalea speifideaquila]|uniref:TonB-dependent receptor plug domain-containing protein n=1 Tax=Paraflavitalea speifideaquila TaxID=3076558 RepID=UPI0028E95725|nr:TonB-dependent receptor plug domain-containing protein [Paraflavitalea speifideiaquila]